ncbi:MAG: alpha/beta hydrolase [Dehalococcoidia bacterium]|nr:alpha/beta hydrolase [Dehalococcoidia bacterium]MDW8119619.1 alpha/beta hydrolase [Chloroflexota bacterium]
MVALDPAVVAFLQQRAQAGIPAFHLLSVEEARNLMRTLAARAPRPPVAKVEDRTIPGPGGPIPVRLYWPQTGTPVGLVVYYHGGGWVLGDLDTHDAPCRHLANASQCLVIAVHYRRAPEHKFPAAVDDAEAAARWAVQNASAWGLSPRRVALAGDSAGGNLVAAVTLRAKERGGPSFAGQVLIYPVTDYTLDRPSYLQNAEGYLLTREGMRWFWGHYLARAEDGAHPLASPLRAPDLTGLPPAIILTAEYDPLRDEGEAYAERLAQAGVPTVCLRYMGNIHGFVGHLLFPGRQALVSIGATLHALITETLQPG